MQRELFDSGIAPLPTRQHYALSGLQNIHFTFRFDQIVMAVIGFLILYVLIFSFGVEQGRKGADSKLISERQRHEAELISFRTKMLDRGFGMPQASDINVVKPAAINTDAPTIEAPAIVQTPSASERGKADSSYPPGKFTIQSVTFNTQVKAEKEIQKYAGKGVTAFVVQSGKYYVLCINGYETKKEANRGLAQLKSEGVVSKDSYVRSMPR